MSQATQAFERSRKALLAAMTARSRKQPIKKVIPFRNDDVPNYLRELDKFEEKSRQANLVVPRNLAGPGLYPDAGIAAMFSP